MFKLSTAVLSAVLALSFSQFAAAQSANTTSPSNPAATPDIEKDQARDKDRATVRRDKRSATGSTAPNRRSPNNPAATPNVRKDDSQHGFTNNEESRAAGGGTAASPSSPSNPAATPDRKRRQEQR